MNRREGNLVSRSSLAVVILMAVGAVMVALGHLPTRNWPMGTDEVLYLLQSNLFGEPKYGRFIDESLTKFFVLRQTYIADHRLYTQFTPGYALVLHAFSFLDLRSWTNTLLTPIGIGSTFLIGRRLISTQVGIVAALLVTVNPVFIFLGGQYLNHTLGLVFSALGAVLLFYGPADLSTTRGVMWVGAGVALGSLVLVRPLTGTTVGLSLFMWVILERKLSKKQIAILVVAGTIGGLAPIGFLLHYNQTANGNPFTLGYEMANHQLHGLGFGKRGYIGYDEQGNPQEKTVDFTPRQAVKQEAHVLYDAVTIFLMPFFLILPLVAISWACGFSARWTVLLIFLPLPVLHSIYFFPDVRFFTEVLPFIDIGIASMLVFLYTKRPFVTKALLAATIILNLIQIGKMTYEEYSFRQTYARLYQRIEDFAKANKKALVFVKRTNGDEYFLEALYWFNVDRFPGDIIVARDIGAENTVLMKKYP